MAAVHELLVLSLLDDKPTYGYDIKQFLSTSYLANCTRISTPQIYAVLRRLQERGLVQTYEERDGNLPPRLVHALTARGRAELLRVLDDDGCVNQRVLFDFDTVLSAMGHLSDLSTEEALAVIRRRLSVVERQLGDCQMAWDSTSAREPLPEVARAICHHRQGYLESELRWLRSLVERVERDGWESLTRPAGP